MLRLVSNPRYLPPRERVQKQGLLATAGLVIYAGTMYRRVYELPVQWSIAMDGTVADTVPGTVSYGGNTYTLEDADPDIQWEEPGGVLTAIYTRYGAWGTSP